MSTFVAAFEGVKLSQTFIVREATLYNLNTGEIKHYFVKPPSPLNLSEQEKKTNSYVQRQLGGVGLHTALPDAVSFERLRTAVAGMGGGKIWCVGHMAEDVLRTILPNGDIEDLSKIMNFVYPKTLVACKCKHRHANPRYCSFNKLWTIVYFLKFKGFY